MSEEEKAVPAPKPRKSGTGYVDFAVKVSIITVALALGAGYVFESIVQTLVSTVNVPSLKTKLRTAMKDEKTRIRLKGLLTTNPAVHYRVSAIEEANGNLDAAIEEIDLALGLLELHQVDRATREKYQARLQDLTRKRAAK
jgi:hypothetical protein